jgi:ABC-type Fe3+ transport system substrate-binding protein
MRRHDHAHSTRGRLAGAIALGAALAFGAGAPGQASAQAAGEWDKIVAAAEAEGEVAVFTMPNIRFRQFVQSQWPKDYPKIKMTQTAIPAQDFVPRLVNERKSNLFLWDAAFNGPIVGYTMMPHAVLDPVLPEFVHADIRNPETWGGWDQAFFDKEQKYVFGVHSFLKTPHYNAKIISPDKVKAAGTRIFLDPKYKGKIMWQDPLLPSGGQTFSMIFRRLLGDDGLRTFVQDHVVFVPQAATIIEKMARGQVAISIGPTVTQQLETYREAGLKLDVRPLGNTPEYGAHASVGGTALMVFNKRPHPNATRVFVNWLASKEVQTALSRAMRLDSRRTDVPSVAEAGAEVVRGVTYIEPARQEHLKEVRDARDFIKAAREAAGPKG